MSLLQGRRYADGFWVRVCGVGVSVRDGRKSPPLFSERYGYVRWWRVGRWIVRWLR